MTHLLLQSTSPPDPSLQLPDDPQAYTVFFWAGLIVVAAILMGVASLAIRKRLLRADEPEPGGMMGFTLADLRKMHDQGHMTDDEFTQAKRRLIATTRAQLAEDEPDPNDHEVHLEGHDPEPAAEESDEFDQAGDGEGDDKPF